MDEDGKNFIWSVFKQINDHDIVLLFFTSNHLHRVLL